MNFDGFTKVSSDKKTTTLKHPKGHTIRVVHSALSKEAQEAIAKVPHYADGGDVVKDFPADSEIADVSAWKQKTIDPILLSVPIPFLTKSTLAPTFSQKFANSFM